jgi:hypothetical protein
VHWVGITEQTSRNCHVLSSSLFYETTRFIQVKPQDSWLSIRKPTAGMKELVSLQLSQLFSGKLWQCYPPISLDRQKMATDHE